MLWNRFIILVLFINTLCVSDTLQTYRLYAEMYECDEATLDQALYYYQLLLEADPANLDYNYRYAYTCTRAGHIHEALKAYQAIATYRPDLPSALSISALYNCGYLLNMMGKIDEAIGYYERILAIDPEHNHAHFSRARAYIHKGDFFLGWQLHERFLKKTGRNADRLRQFLATGALNGKRILLTPEGGLGDTIQFIRYAKDLKAQGAYVIAAVQPQLIPLCSLCISIDRVFSIKDPVPLPDAQVSLMTLPAVFNADEQSMGQAVPYIVPLERLEKKWRDELSSDTNFKIGICWQASVENDASRLPVGRRGIPLQLLMQLAEIPGVSLYSLQQYDGLEELQHLDNPSLLKVFDDTFDKEYGSFMDTAAVMHSLDLIITIDSAVAHLAGAMGRPVWLLLPYETDWRWIADRSDSPWYPTMRIFKQQEPFGWAQVVDHVLDALFFLHSRLNGRITP